MPRGQARRVVSNKPIKPEPAVEEPKPDEIVKYFEQIPEPARPKIKLLAVRHFQNYSIGEGINWLAGTVHEVDWPTFERLMRDDPTAFERV